MTNLFKSCQSYLQNYAHKKNIVSYIMEWSETNWVYIFLERTNYKECCRWYRYYRLIIIFKNINMNILQLRNKDVINKANNQHMYWVSRDSGVMSIEKMMFLFLWLFSNTSAYNLIYSFWYLAAVLCSTALFIG